jgi:hypothetical protein
VSSESVVISIGALTILVVRYKVSRCEAYFNVGSRTDRRVTFLCLGKEK